MEQRGVAGPWHSCYGIRVGHVSVKAEIEARRRATVEFLVDTGATHTIIPPELATEIGAPTLPRRFTVHLADGRQRRLQACSLGLTVASRSAPIIALLLPGGQPLLGVEALEALGLKVNPRRRCLEPSRAATALLVGVRPVHLRRVVRQHRSRTRRSS
jgi:clan AA aspartic protease